MALAIHNVRVRNCIKVSKYIQLIILTNYTYYYYGLTTLCILLIIDLLTYALNKLTTSSIDHTSHESYTLVYLLAKFRNSAKSY